MKTVSCPRCNLVTWSTAISCKRCDYVFETTAEQGAETSSSSSSSAETSFSPAAHGTENHAVRQHQQEAFNNYVEPVQSPPPTAAAASQYRQNWQQQNWQQQNQRNQYGGQNYQGHQYTSEKKKIGLAVWSMILGIVGFPPLAVFLGIFISALLGAFLGTAGVIIGGALTLAVIPSGLITGVVALRRVNKPMSEYGGKGFAVAGVACSSVGLIILPMVAVIAIPNLMSARRAANEGSAISMMQKLVAAEEKYMTSMAGRCGDTKALFAGQLIDAEAAKGEKNGYRFLIVNLPPGGCEIHATPLSASQGTRSFYYTTEDKLIRWAKKDGKLAGKDDHLLGEEDELTDKKAENDFVKPDESAAIATLRTLHGAQVTYIATAGQGRCGDLQTLANQGLIKQSLADGEEAGYRFVLTKLPSNNWEISATPRSGGAGTRSFYLSQDGVIRGGMKNGLTADKNDPPVNF